MPLYLFVLVAAILIGIALAPKPTVPQPATLEDFDFPKADEGGPQIVIFGDVWINGWTVLEYGNLRADPIYGEGGKK